ncbi:CHAT domain-containing protein [Nonomuraea sp. NPDC050451]|uniref:CHAT domain-containing protein n=1 Tax=Nonomuraea sp. NPDC050451 TaxID=3364364 RepID=UPI0037AA8B51
MVAFYENRRRDGLSPADALRAARRWMRSTSSGGLARQQQTTRPAGWAACCHIGR